MKNLLGCLTWISGVMGALFCAVWLWDRWCVFPGNYWNDLRLAPTIAFFRGFSVYSSGDGIANTWLYGPLPIMLMWPVACAKTAVGVLEIGATLTIGLPTIIVAAVCWSWPSRNSPVGKFTAAVICVLLSVSAYFCADIPAIGFGLLGNLFLIHRKMWPAAICAVSAVACKQLAVSLLLAQLVWLIVTNRNEVKNQLIRYCVVALGLGGFAVWIFGAKNLWHTMVELPGGLPWTDEPLKHLSQSSNYLLLYTFVPVVAMLTWRSFFWRPDSPLLLPSISFFTALPLGVIALFKTGGGTNSIHSFALWMPALVPVVLHSKRPRVLLGCSLLVAGFAFWRLNDHPLTMIPELQAYNEAAYLASRAPDRCWFPTNPLVTLCAQNRYYHDEDGLYERKVAGYPLTEAQIKAGLPVDQRVTVFPHIWVDYSFWGIAEERLPKGAVIYPFGRWWVVGDLPRLLH